MKKSLLLVILSILIILPILAQDKLVIIGVDAEDSESRYIKTILEKETLMQHSKITNSCKWYL